MMTSHVHFIVSLRFCRQVCRALRVLKQAESIHSFDSAIILIKHLTWSESDQDWPTVEFWRLLNSMTYLSHARCQLRHVGKKEPVPWCLASFCIDTLIQKFVPVCHDEIPDEIPDAHKGCFGLLLYHVQKQWKVAMKITVFFCSNPNLYVFSEQFSSNRSWESHWSLRCFVQRAVQGQRGSVSVDRASNIGNCPKYPQYENPPSLCFWNVCRL